VIIQLKFIRSIHDNSINIQPLGSE